MASVQGSLELVADRRAALGEGPLWDPAGGVLWWVDVFAGLVHRTDPRTGADRAFEVGSPVSAVTLRRDGSVLAAAATGLVAVDLEGGQPRTLLAFAHDDGDSRCNDGKCDPAGRFLVGRMAMDAAPGRGSLVCVSPDLRVTTRLTGLAIPNGLAWSPDGGVMYYVDSVWGEVRAYPYEVSTGELGGPRTLVRFPDDGSLPDGMTIDVEGHLWLARWGAGCVVRVSPDGAIVDRVDLPVSRVTSCTFGGDDLGDLYITTARGDTADGDEDREPSAGGLFRCRPGVPGTPPVLFAG